MRFRSSHRVGIAAIMAAAMVGSGTVTMAESPGASLAPSLGPCQPMTDARWPLPGPGAVVAQAFGVQNPAFPDPDPAYAGRFHPGEDWAYPVDAATTPVVAIGNGRLIAAGPIGIGGQGSIVVVEHAGPVTVPASTAGQPWSYPSESLDDVPPSMAWARSVSTARPDLGHLASSEDNPSPGSASPDLRTRRMTGASATGGPRR